MVRVGPGAGRGVEESARRQAEAAARYQNSDIRFMNLPQLFTHNPSAVLRGFLISGLNRISVPSQAAQLFVDLQLQLMDPERDDIVLCGNAQRIGMSEPMENGVHSLYHTLCIGKGQFTCDPMGEVEIRNDMTRRRRVIEYGGVYRSTAQGDHRLCVLEKECVCVKRRCLLDKEGNPNLKAECYTQMARYGRGFPPSGETD